MNYRQTLQYLYARLPLFQRIGPAAYKGDLSNTIELCSLTGNPEKQIRTIHVAGTNGKGSVSHFLAAILQSAGYKTGLYTSPHLKDFRERIKINGKMIDRKYVIEFVKKYKTRSEKIAPSFFEFTVVMAFSYFRDKRVDIAVIETGMGGRLDSTNVITAELSVITNISFDHTDILGNTLKKIAAEKAGIIKPGVPVVIGEYAEETKKVFLKAAEKNNSPIVFASDKPVKHNYKSELTGNYQEKNINTVLYAIEQLKNSGKKKDRQINENDVKRGIGRVVTLTGLRGRWEKLGEKPAVYADIAHNLAGISELVKQIEKLKYEKLHVVIGMVNDKEIKPILKLLPRNATYYFTRAKIPRAMDEELLKIRAEVYGLKGNAYKRVRSAFAAAKKSASKNDLIIITGSAFVVAEVI